MIIPSITRASAYSLIALACSLPMLAKSLVAQTENAPIFTPKIDNIQSIKADGKPAFSVDGDTLNVSFPEGGQYPGLNVPLASNPLNLSGFTGVQAEITNTGSTDVKIVMRVDNPGDWKTSPWSADNVWLEPGQTKLLKVTFGQSNGRPGYALDASQISNIKIFAEKPKAGAAITVGPIVPIKGATAQEQSAVNNTGQDATFSPSIDGNLIDLSKGLSGYKFNNSTAIIENDQIKVTFKSGANYPNIVFPIPQGGWNLSAFGQLAVTITNESDRKLSIYMRADNPGPWKESRWNTEKTLFAPGETKEVKLTFGKQNGAPAFPLNPARISAIQIFLSHPKTDTTLLISDLKGTGSAADAANELSFTKPEDRNTPAVLPDWLGTRPPVEGDWVLTLDENFDGEQLDTSLWTKQFPWNGPMGGQKQRYAPQNVIVSNGVATFKVEKIFGHENNDPELGTRDYTSGLIQSYDKWAQLYGYFEARIKVPYVRGLWPAYWMMPDRGEASGLNIWQRRQTTNGAMEIDIMEILSEWGPGRNSVATHWDGYGADHKQWGTSQIYYGPTPDDFHVFGLLWEPGKLTWYVDGKKVAELIGEHVSNAPSYLKFNVQMGGWATSDIDDANLPAVMEVDYTRAWQLKSRQ
jgi:beta-glucanase (GH16 family)